MAIIFCADVSAHLLLLWGTGSRQELGISSVHSNINLADCSRGGRQLCHSMSFREQRSAQGRTVVAHGAGRGAAADTQAAAAAPAEAGLDKEKDRAASRRESAASGGTAQTLASSVVTWHVAKCCCCRAALNRSDEEHLDGEG